MTVSRETATAIGVYVGAVNSWNKAIALVGPAQAVDIEGRAIDQAVLLNTLMPKGPVPRWVDLGSGAGLPAIPLAILRRALEDDLTLVDADRRKAAFLRHALRETGLAGTVLAGRIETIEPLAANVITARALAPLGVLAGYGHRHLAPGGRLLALKGRNVEAELTDMHRRWTAEVRVHTSAGETVVVEMSNITPKSSEDRNDA